MYGSLTTLLAYNIDFSNNLMKWDFSREVKRDITWEGIDKELIDAVVYASLHTASLSALSDSPPCPSFFT